MVRYEWSCVNRVTLQTMAQTAADEASPLLSEKYSATSLTSVHGTTDPDDSENIHRKKRLGMTSHLAFAVAVCTLGSSFQLGYSAAVMNEPADVMKSFYNDTYQHRNGEPMSKSLLTLLWGITVSIFAAGAMLGGLSSGYWANKFGRRGGLLWNNGLAVVAALLLGFSKLAKSYEMLIIGRIIIGINCGVNSALAPLYLSEISPVSLRGLCGTFNQIAICFGTFIAELIGLNVLLGTDTLWPLTLGFILVPAIFQLMTLPFCPETPQFQMEALKTQEAQKGLTWLRGTEDVEEELEEMRKEAVELHNSAKFSVLDLFKNPELRWPLIISVVLQLAQQFSGISAVVYYSTNVFEGAGLSQSVSQYATVATGVVSVTATFVSALLMDRLGRRTLMISGLAGLLVCTTVLTLSLVFQDSASWLSYLSIAAVVLYYVAFSIGPGAIPWFYVAELFAQGPRSAAVSVAMLVNWLSNFITGLVFPELQEAIDEYSFVPFIVLMVAAVIFIILFAPETKGKRIEDITMMFKAPDKKEKSASNQLQENSCPDIDMVRPIQ